MTLLEDETYPRPSQSYVVFRTILITLTVVAVMINAVASIYFYTEYRKTSAQIADLQANLEIVKSAVATKSDKPKIRSVEDALSELDTKISSLQLDIDTIQSSVESMESDVSSISSKVRSIESDVSSIQLKVG